MSIQKELKTMNHLDRESGAAMVIALLVLSLMLGFVALAVSRTTAETIASSNDAAESRAFSASQASLEVMTRNFDKIFEEKLSPTPADLVRVKSLTPPDFGTMYDFQQELSQTKATETVVMSGQLLQGLNALRDEWQLDSVATDKSSGVQVALRRKFYNNRVPIFQFGIFYDDDLEFHPGPRFDFGGRVHANGNLYLMAQTGLYFSSRVSAVGHIIADTARNGRDWSQWGENVFVKNGSGTYVKLLNSMGSVVKSPTNGTNVFSANSDMPAGYVNPSWPSNKNLFQGNLLSEQRRLDLPLKIASTINGNALDYIELIKRGKNTGDLYSNNGLLSPVTTAVEYTGITSKERYANKKGIRISLSDSKAKLPGCASGTGTLSVATVCGVRLDGSSSGDGSDPSFGEARGYTPKSMTDGYQATRINGERFFVSGRQSWIKIELVQINASTGLIETVDVTEDLLSLGLTDAATSISVSGVTRFALNSYGNTDSRSIVKLQRFNIPGPPLTAADTTNMTSFSAWQGNLIIAEKDPTDAAAIQDSGFVDHPAHMKSAIVDDATKARKVAPFPIKLFDTREGLYNDDITPTNTGIYGNNVPWAGVMSVVDLDVANLKRFLDGEFNTLTPTTGTAFTTIAGVGLKNTDVPDSNGWVLYVSDRRGDGDFDGEYDMEDVYGNNDGTRQPGEDINNNGTLDFDFSNEAVPYTGTGNHASPTFAATVEHSYYRRAVRLINGTVLPGIYDAADSLNTKGFTVASENAVYVKGNYNATGISSVGTPTASNQYLPQNTAAHVPASVVGDAVIVLSNSWSDARSFRYPFTLNQRVASETTVRFAMLAGDARSSLEGTPNQGGGDPRLTGGVHNFKRFLETWGSSRLNYAGSLINLYNSRNNNGSFKCCAKVYGPPTRNWVFDTTFLDPTRLPPGTPFFQTIQLTGFQRVN